MIFILFLSLPQSDLSPTDGFRRSATSYRFYETVNKKSSNPAFSQVMKIAGYTQIVGITVESYHTKITESLL